MPWETGADVMPGSVSLRGFKSANFPETSESTGFTFPPTPVHSLFGVLDEIEGKLVLDAESLMITEDRLLWR